MSRWSIALIVLAVAVAATCNLWWPSPAEAESPPPPPAPPPLETVGERDLVQAIELRGAVFYRRVHLVQARASAPVASHRIALWARCRQGEVLCELDLEEQRRTLELAQLRLDQARDDLARLQQGLKQDEALELDLKVARLELEVRRQEEELALKEELVEEGLEARRTVETLREDLALQRRQLEAARFYRQRAGKAEEQDLVAKRRQIKAAELEMVELRRRLEHSTITAPVDGIIIAVPEGLPGTNLEARNLRVSEGQELCRVAEAEGRLVKMELPGRYLEQVQPGMAVEVRLDPEEPAAVVGQLDRIACVGEPGHQDSTFAAEVVLPPEGDRLHPGSTVRCRIELARREQTVAVPVTCIAYEGDTPYAMKWDRGRAERQDLELGIDDDEFVEVLSGLAPGDRVLKDAR